MRRKRRRRRIGGGGGGGQEVVVLEWRCLRMRNTRCEVEAIVPVKAVLLLIAFIRYRCIEVHQSNLLMFRRIGPTRKGRESTTKRVQKRFT